MIESIKKMSGDDMDDLALQIENILTIERYLSTARLGYLLRNKGVSVRKGAILKTCKKLALSGLIKKHHYSSCNNYVWEISANNGVSAPN